MSWVYVEREQFVRMCEKVDVSALDPGRPDAKCVIQPSSEEIKTTSGEPRPWEKLGTGSAKKLSMLSSNTARLSVGIFNTYPCVILIISCLNLQ